MNKYHEALNQVKKTTVVRNSWEYRAFRDDDPNLELLQELVDVKLDKIIELSSIAYARLEAANDTDSQEIAEHRIAKAMDCLLQIQRLLDTEDEDL